MPLTDTSPDAVINGTRLALYKEGTDDLGNPILGWRRVGTKDAQLTTPEDDLIAALWDKGWSGGMGMAQDYLSQLTRPGTLDMGDAYAFTVGVDATAPGFARLHGRRITGTPTNAPVDANTMFFEKSSAGNATFLTGSFVKGAGASQVVTHNMGITSKAIYLWSSGGTSDGTVAAGARCFRGMTDGTTARSVTWSSQDAQATSNSASRLSSKAISLIDASGSGSQPEGAIAFTNANSFTITWTNNDATADIIHYIIVAGSDVSAKVVSSNFTNLVTGNYAVTGVGFQPEVVLHIGAGTPTGVDNTASDANVMQGAMDSSGNQFVSAAFDKDNEADSFTKRWQSTSYALAKLALGAFPVVAASFVSMDADGYTVNASINIGGDFYFASLCLKGLRAKVGAFTKVTDVGNQGAQDIGFSTTAFMLSSIGTTAITSLVTVTQAQLCMGAASSTSTEQASAWSAEHLQATTDTYSVDDTALAFEIPDVTDGSEDSLATCGNVNMEVAGWLNWSAASATAEQICYVAFAANASVLSATPNIIATNDNYGYIMSVTNNVITFTEEKDLGSTAVAGFGCEFRDAQYIPCGKSANAYKLTNVSASGVGTWVDLGYRAVAFETLQDGVTSRIVKGFALSAGDAANRIDLSSNGTSYAGSNYEVGDTSDDIVKIVDSGARLGVAKQRNFWIVDGSTGGSEKVTSEAGKSATNGVGTVAYQGTETFFYNHGAKDFFFDGVSRPQDVGIDSIPFNRRQNAAVAVWPRGGKYYESHIHGNFKYSLYRVTESATDYTYIEVRQFLNGRWVRHSYDRLTGVARGMFLDSNFRLWTAWVTQGVFLYYQFGKDGAPDPGRDGIGFGAASTTYTMYLPELDFQLGDTTKKLWQMHVVARNIDSTCPITLGCLRDTTDTTIGTTITSGGVSKRHFTNGTNDEAVRVRPYVQIVTTAGYAPASGDPQILEVGLRAWPQPDKQAVVEMNIDTDEVMGNGEVPEDSKKIRDDIAALVGGDPVACTDPDGNAITLRFIDVEDFKVRLPNEERRIHYVVRARAVERTAPS